MSTKFSAIAAVVARSVPPPPPLHAGIPPKGLGLLTEMPHEVTPNA